MHVIKESTKAKFERIKAEVLTLTPKQKVDIVKLLAKSEDDTVDEAKVAGFSGLLLGAVVDYLVSKQGASARVPYAVLAPKLGRVLIDATRAVQTFLVDNIENVRPMREIERAACCLFLVDLAEKYLTKIGIPVSPKTLTQQLVRVGVVFDNAFPGYISGGLVPVVFEARGCLHKH